MTPMRELTVKELDQVSGGAALNFFFNSSGVVVKKLTGSTVQGNDSGASNRHSHVANK